MKLSPLLTLKEREQEKIPCMGGGTFLSPLEESKTQAEEGHQRPEKQPAARWTKRRGVVLMTSFSLVREREEFGSRGGVPGKKIERLVGGEYRSGKSLAKKGANLLI